jgi:hypothetical protein
METVVPDLHASAPEPWGFGPRRRSASSVSEICNMDETFSERHRLDEDFEIIPGHTGRTTALLWDTGEHHALFTGETVFFIRGRWRAAPTVAGLAPRAGR